MMVLVLVTLEWTGSFLRVCMFGYLYNFSEASFFS